MTKISWKQVLAFRLDRHSLASRAPAGSPDETQRLASVLDATRELSLAA